MTPVRPRQRRAFSLVELMVSMTAMTVLMFGIAASVTLASKAIPSSDSAFTAEIDGYHAVEQITAELLAARSFTVKSTHVIEFTVADRNADNSPETIRYEWSGTQGASLTRKYNTNAPVVVANNAYEFELRYGERVASETTTQEVTTNTAESVLAYFNGWSGITPSLSSKPASTTSWVSEYFTVSPPSGATSLTFSKADVRLTGGTTEPLPGVTVAVHRSKNDGTYITDATPIGPPTEVPASSLTTSTQWLTVLFSGVTVNDPSRTDYCLMFKGTNSNSAWVEYFSSSSAPDDGMVMRWTTDSGSTWDPPNRNIDKQDVRFTSYGYFTTTSTQTVTVEHHYLKSVRVILRIGSNPATRVESSVQVLNEPEVTGL